MEKPAGRCDRSLCAAFQIWEVRCCNRVVCRELCRPDEMGVGAGVKMGVPVRTNGRWAQAQEKECVPLRLVG